MTLKREKNEDITFYNTFTGDEQYDFFHPSVIGDTNKVTNTFLVL